MISPDAVIGGGVVIDGEVTIYPGVTIGPGSMLQAGCYLPPGVSIGERVFIGPHAVFTNDRHPQANNPAFVPEATIVGDNAVIGAGAVILPVRIGAGAVVAAGAVVVRDVEAGAVVAGNPARRVR